jgi:Zn ribbon nucleic-acid-binding protein
VAATQPPERAVCPKCHERHTVKATDTWEKEIHFCVDCGQSFTVKKTQELSGKSEVRSQN